MYDAIVIGARCAGSPLAMLLARKSYRVLLMDRDTFPSDTLSTTFLRADAVRRLQEWGLFDQVIAAGTPTPPVVTLYWNGTPFPAPPMGYPPMAPRRTVFDTILVEAARAAGAEVREAFSCQDLVRDGTGAVAGIIGQTRDGDQVMEEARIVVGADGRNSFVARAVEAEEYDVREPHSCGFYTYFDNVPPDGFEIHLRARHFLFSFPTNDNKMCAGLEAPLECWDELRKDPEAYVLGAFEKWAPAISERLKVSTGHERWLGMTGRRSFFRKPYGPGWALVGDAGFLKDPILGTGVDDAMRDAELLANALDEGFSGRKPMEDALSGYQHVRDTSVKDLYDVICDMARMEEVSPELLGRMALAQAAAAAA